jgi:hypothetical protein
MIYNAMNLYELTNLKKNAAPEAPSRSIQNTFLNKEISTLGFILLVFIFNIIFFISNFIFIELIYNNMTIDFITLIIIFSVNISMLIVFFFIIKYLDKFINYIFFLFLFVFFLMFFLCGLAMKSSQLCLYDEGILGLCNMLDIPGFLFLKAMSLLGIGAALSLLTGYLSSLGNLNSLLLGFLAGLSLFFALLAFASFIDLFRGIQPFDKGAHINNSAFKDNKNNKNNKNKDDPDQKKENKDTQGLD